MAPVVLTVPVANPDPFDHNVFSASDSNQFDLERYGRGETRAQTFAHPGLVRVFCNIHPRMVAFVQVMSGRLFTQPASDGSFVISDVPPGAYTLHVWHERSPEVTREVRVTAPGAVGVDVEVAASACGVVPVKRKCGEERAQR